MVPAVYMHNSATILTSEASEKEWRPYRSKLKATSNEPALNGGLLPIGREKRIPYIVPREYIPVLPNPQ